jgi:hypothetical protein
MSRSRILLTLALAATLATPCAFGAARQERAGPRPVDLASRLWGSLTAIWAEIGCKIDPHGGCEPGESEEDSVPPETDIGFNIDPHG